MSNALDCQEQAQGRIKMLSAIEKGAVKALSTAAEHIGQLETNLDQALGDVASIRDDKNRRIAELEAALKDLQCLPVEGMGVKYNYPYWKVREIAKKVLQSAGEKRK